MVGIREDRFVGIMSTQEEQLSRVFWFPENRVNGLTQCRGKDLIKGPDPSTL